MAKPIQWTPELVERFWSGLSGTSLSRLNFSQSAASYLIELIGDHLKPHGRHLDFGAGDGDLVRALVQRGYATAAFEPVGVRSAKTALDIAHHPQYLGLIKDDSPDRFDVVLMIEVIEHILGEKLLSALQKVRSLLKDGGTLIITTPDSEDLELSSAYCPNCDTLFHRWQHQRSFTPESLPALLAEHGFECLSLRRVDFSYNRFLVADLRYLHGELEKIWIRRQQSFYSRLRRIVFRMKPESPIRLQSSLAGAPTTLVYIGTPRKD